MSKKWFICYIICYILLNFYKYLVFKYIKMDKEKIKARFFSQL